ncbi:MAG TPA: helix-turn-helix transcriptional regulator [Pseudonocardiaceae bacterium]
MSIPKLNSTRDRHWICAQRLRERRLALGLTQREVVDRLRGCGSNTTNRALSAMEHGQGLDVGLLPDLAESLGCSVTYLLGLVDDPAAWHPDDVDPVIPEQLPVPAAASPEPPGRADGVTGPPSWRTPGILGPDLPAGFAAPGRARRRGVAAG